MASPIEGIYVAYLTGKAGTGFAMLIIRNGKITGADPLGAVYDGVYSKKPDNNYNVKLKSVLQPNIPLI